MAGGSVHSQKVKGLMQDPTNAALRSLAKEFFGSFQLSQFMTQKRFRDSWLSAAAPRYPGYLTGVRA